MDRMIEYMEPRASIESRVYMIEEIHKMKQRRR